jgi:hypothetical protein
MALCRVQIPRHRHQMCCSSEWRKWAKNQRNRRLRRLSKDLTAVPVLQQYEGRAA